MKDKTVDNVIKRIDHLLVEDDPVNSPEHYTFGGIECIDYIEAKQLGYLRGNAIKYISRAKLKGNLIEDIEKAIWYLQRYVEKERRNEDSNQ
jgi:predicted HTH transcriptional regulator